MACARAAGFENVSIDLIFGVPGQTPGDLEADLADALALAPEHVSWYELELKPGSALARRGLPPVDEDEGADAYRRIVSGLEAAGYRWYETTNFARAGRGAATAWPTGARATTSGWGSAPSAPSANSDGATGRAWRRTSPRWPAARSRPARPIPSTATTCAASAGCSACGWPTASTRRGPARRTGPRRCGAWPWRAAARERRRRGPHPRGPVRAERRPPAHGVRVSPRDDLGDLRPRQGSSSARSWRSTSPPARRSAARTSPGARASTSPRPRSATSSPASRSWATSTTHTSAGRVPPTRATGTTSTPC